MTSLAALNATETRRLQGALLAWFGEHKRDLPWRKDRDPYRVWVSEVMLQQTQVSTVVPYFERWMKRYPTVETLARASEPEVLKAWEGLGYYSRARNLIRGANYVVTAHAGQLPESVEHLRRVPGIGRYTAGAIASIAFEKPEPILDGNVMRVLCRLRDVAGDPRKAPLHESLWSLARQLVTNADARSLNESLMELGALVCTPKNPMCALCPVRRQCRALANQTVDKRPEVGRNIASTKREVQILLVTHGRQRILMQQRDTTSTPWANLWAFPYLEFPASRTPLGQIRRWAEQTLGDTPSRIAVVTEGKYSVTRYRFEYQAFAFSVLERPKEKLPDGYCWVARSRLSKLAMPAPHRRVSEVWLRR